MDVLSEGDWKQQEALMLIAAERELGGAMLSAVEEEAEEKEVGVGEEEKAEAGAAEKRPRKAAGVSKEERSSPTPGPPRKSALWRADQLDDDTTDVASTAGSSASAWLSEAPTDFATDLADVADVRSLKQFSTAVAGRRARAPPPVNRTLSTASTVVLEEEEEGEEEEEKEVAAKVQEVVEAEEKAAQRGFAAEVEPVLSEGEWGRQESLMLLAAKESPLLLAAEEEEQQAAEEEQGHAPGAALLGASATAAPPVPPPPLAPPLLPPPTVGAVVGAVPHAAAVAPGTAPRAAAAAPTAELLAWTAVIFVSGGVFVAVCFTLAEVEIKGVCHSAALVAPHVVQWLLWARKLRLLGCRHPFLVGVPMALVCYGMLIGLFSHATTSLLLDEVTLQGSAAANSSSSSEVKNHLENWLMSPEFSAQEQHFHDALGP